MEPIDNCPLCASGAKLAQKIFIHMIQYVRNAEGHIEAVPVVWERSAGQYATKLKTLIEEYGPLSDCIFKIRRNGKEGDKDTTYEILFGAPNIYKEELYPKNTEVFKDYTALGRIVLNKNANEIVEFLTTGNFPQRTRESNNTANVAQTPVDNTVNNPSFNPPTSNYGADSYTPREPVAYPNTPTGPSVPNAYNNPTTNRPTRYY
jgi:hypothetical protein